jgi:hypothetical protein
MGPEESKKAKLLGKGPTIKELLHSQTFAKFVKQIES